MKNIQKLILAAIALISFSLSPIKPAKAVSVTPQTPTMGVLGDSISAGWTGTAYNLNQSYPDFLRQDLGLASDQLINYSVPHARIVGNRYADCRLGKHTGQDLRNQILQHKTVISHLKTLYIAFGLNDYASHSGSGSIKNISQTLARYLQYIKRLNPQIKLYGVLPLVGYSSHNNSYDIVPNDRHFTLRQLRTSLSKTYVKAGAQAINPNLAHAVTAQNRLTTLADQHMHPTVATNQVIGRYLAKIVNR